MVSLEVRKSTVCANPTSFPSNVKEIDWLSMMWIGD